MRDLNKLKTSLKKEMIEDKFDLHPNTIRQIKNDIFEVLKKYTNLKSENININIKILNSNDYLIDIVLKVNEIY